MPNQLFIMAPMTSTRTPGFETDEQTPIAIPSKMQVEAFAIGEMNRAIEGRFGREGIDSMTPEEKLKELGIELKEATMAAPAMVAGKVAGNLLYLSGSTPPPRDGKPWKGRVGETYSVEEGYQAAREVAILQLAAAKTVLGDLSRIKQVVKVLGMVNCTPGFEQTPRVMHGFSDLLFEVLGEKGRHARSAVGLQALPGNVPIEVETIFEVES